MQGNIIPIKRDYQIVITGKISRADNEVFTLPTKREFRLLGIEAEIIEILLEAEK